MRALVQRVSRASVRVDGSSIGAIERGLCAFIGVGHDDGANDARLLADRLTGLRVFEDADGKMNLSLAEVGGSLLVISQFTLMADTRRGRRPSFTEAAQPDRARVLIEELVARARTGPVPVVTGAFGAHMIVDLCNDGPVTLMLDTKDASGQAS